MKIIKCLNCNKEFQTKKGKFCSQSCSATYNNSRRTINRKPILGKSTKTATCLNCNKEFKYHTYNSKGLYCSNKCRGEYVLKQSDQLLQEGKLKGPVNIKKAVIRLKGNKCEICGLTEWLNKSISLHLDHIDGNADNNNPNNLRLLCPNCHSQTPTYCSRNTKNSKRSNYMKRYRKRKLG